MESLSEEDYEYTFQVGIAHIIYILEYFKNIWPQSIISYKDGNIINLRKASPQQIFNDKRFIIYESNDFFEQWEDVGYSDDLSDKAILVIFSDEKLFFTYGYDKTKSSQFIERIVEYLMFNNKFYLFSNTKIPEGKFTQ